MVTVKASRSELCDPRIELFNNRCSQRDELFALMKDYGVPLCDRAWHEATGIQLSSVKARRSELVDLKLVKFYFKAKTPFSNIRVKHWGII